MKTNMDSNQRIDYLYKEYARLNEKLEEHIKSSFEDFKLLGAAGASIIFWKPIVDAIVLTNSRINYNGLLFIGFLSLLLFFVLIGFVSLIRTTVMFSISSNLLSFEQEIRKELNEVESSQVFGLNLARDTAKFSEAYRLTYGTTLIILALAITFIPFVIFYVDIGYAVAYAFLALLAVVIFMQVLRKLTRIFFNQFRVF